MRNEHVLSELSAYLDGEAKDPDAIQRHLQQCPDCARRYMELSKVSSHLKALRGPEVHPAFATRVMAHVAETKQVENVWRWVGATAVLAATLVLVVEFIHLAYAPTGQSVRQSASANVNAEQILAEIERRVAQGEDVQIELPVAMGEENVFLVSSLDTASQDLAGDESLENVALETIATEGWLGDSAADIQSVDDMGTDSDVATSIKELDESEAATLKELLIEYAMEGTTS